jgi:NADH-quinone oxidoreductase subunit E/NADP-reducing hydrogenase subunit HndA
MIGEKVHGRVKKEDLPKIIENYKTKAKEEGII